MSRTPEGKVKDKIKELFANISKRYPGRLWYCMPMGQLYGKRGVPDFLVCLNGKFLAIEAKAEGGKLAAMQKLELGGIAQAGGYNLVVYPENYASLVRMVNELAEFGTTGEPNSISLYETIR